MTLLYGFIFVSGRVGKESPCSHLFLKCLLLFQEKTYCIRSIPSIVRSDMDFEKKKIWLAPLAGVTEPIFRQICRDHGADVVVTEMVSAEGLRFGAEATRDLARFAETERPIGVQLFGSDPRSLGEAAAWTGEHTRPDFIDLNAGCPVPKVVKKNGGSSLLRDPVRFRDILTSMVRATSVPITVKIRSGWTVGEWVDVELAKIAEDCGVRAIAVHPRSRSMGFSGHSYWERIAKVKKSVSVPVIGNGDIRNGTDALTMLEQTGCDCIMVGRAAQGNPWIFSEIRAALEGTRYVPPDIGTRCEMIRSHVSEYAARYGERRAGAEMKKQICWYIKGHPGASQLRSRVFKADSSAELIELVALWERENDR